MSTIINESVLDYKHDATKQKNRHKLESLNKLPILKQKLTSVIKFN